VKIIDFGLATYLTKNKMKEHIGTPYYVCPEIIDKSGYNEKCDIWSFGICVAWALTGEYPFQGEDFDELIDSILHKEPKLNGNISSEALDLISKLL